MNACATFKVMPDVLPNALPALKEFDKSTDPPFGLVKEIRSKKSRKANPIIMIIFMVDIPTTLFLNSL
jgi:hypothetical protein